MDETKTTHTIHPLRAGNRIADAVNSLIAVGSGKILLVNVENGPAHVENAVRSAIASQPGIQVLRHCLSASHTEFPSGTDTTSELVEFDPDLIVICTDSFKDELLSHLNNVSWRRFPQVATFGSAHQEAFASQLASFDKTLAEESHAIGYEYAKAHIFDVLKSLSRRNCSGLVVELGVFRGGTLLLMKQMLKSLNFTGAQLVGFDTFNGFPPPRCLLDMFAMDEFVNRDFAGTSNLLAAEDIRLVRGDIVETIKQLEDQRLLLTFVDTDNYSPAAAALPVCWKNTVVGGAIIMDHFYTKEAFADTIGERIAAWEFFKNRTDFVHLSATGVFIKI